ncbi:SseB protein N-terminal domain-containing protein [Sporobacter termitidis DSM 10068]|uniref:SseB protein N-terminal domain-containing protein n=1 Tax=Sporobacter termitidis DSM 10068 TaxID=1123282 RepID=A0A1M5YSD0_9FIRM|nr:enhanced serine sensitivity protein SseB C-terminal domain-containing protein [Sporobacter termitidis]SHI14942.1 SseB protein N-terminal domain-containing protein [Sporobacter termitidis DSM 10068]
MEQKFTNPGDELFRRYEELQSNPNSAKFLCFCQTLLKSAMLVPRHAEGKGLSILSDQKGGNFIPAFTSREDYGKWIFPTGGEANISFSMLSNTVVDDARLGGIVINPFGRQIILRRENLQMIRRATTEMTVNRVDHTEKMIFEDTRDYPPKLPEALARALSRRPEVCEAYILSAREEYEEEPHLLFLIDFDGDRKLLFPYVADIIRPYMKKDVSFELLKATYTTLLAAREKAKPIYKRAAGASEQVPVP